MEELNDHYDDREEKAKKEIKDISEKLRERGSSPSMMHQEGRMRRETRIRANERR